MRLNKYISHNSKYSRRDADKLIEEGRVTINREVIKDYGFDIQDEDLVYLDNRAIKKRTELTMIVYNKPKGVLVTKKDDRGRATIYHKMNGKFRHFIPIGRLDYASEGLLLLTDSPNVATALMNSNLQRTYNLKLDKPITTEIIEAMKSGLSIDDASKGAHSHSKIKSMEFAPFDAFEIRSQGEHFSKIRVTISEGKNRELRRFFGYFDANVLDLKRVGFGYIELNNLPTNKTRYFTRREYDDLYKFLKQKDKDEVIDSKNQENHKAQLKQNRKKRVQEKKDKEYYKNRDKKS